MIKRCGIGGPDGGALKLVYLAATVPGLEFREEVPAPVYVDASDIKAAQRGTRLLQLQLSSDRSTYFSNVRRESLNWNISAQVMRYSHCAVSQVKLQHGLYIFHLDHMHLTARALVH